MHSAQPITTPEDRLDAAIKRILHFKMVPEHQLSMLGSQLMERLFERRHMNEGELVVLYLHQGGREVP
jgi:hypothetical protein